MEDLYLLLGVRPTATQGEILAAFEEKKVEQQIIMKGAAGTALEEKAAVKLQLLFKAKKILTDASARAAYDAQYGYGAPAPKQPVGFAMPTPEPAYSAPVQHAAPVAQAAPVSYAGANAGYVPQPQTVAPAYAANQPVYAAPASQAPAYSAPAMPATSSLPALGQAPFMPKARPNIPAKPLWIAVDPKKAGADKRILLYPKMANRHGLIAGATGTGKTVTLKVLAEHFSDIGVPVFLADIKGDVWSMCNPGSMNAGLEKRIRTKLTLEPTPEVFEGKGYPMRFWDVYGKKGHPVRTTISAMGPELLARLLELNETQTGVLNIVFRYADDNGLLILDMKDLRTMIKYCAEHAEELQNSYGNVSSQSVGAIQRALLRLEDAGGNIFFGEPALDLNDWFTYDASGRGTINLLHCAELFQHPVLYSTFLLWMLSGLYDMLPEKGDADKPEIVFFFDEAHLIFKDAPKSLLDKVEQIVRLIRSKGVGVYFISQLPADIPNSVLSQLGNKVQHALRAYTPKDQLALKSAAKSFRANPGINTETALSELGTGEALVSFMGEDGKPSMVERGYIMPPNSTLDVLDESIRQGLIVQDAFYNQKYKNMFDRESAYEMLQYKMDEAKQAEIAAAEEKARQKEEAERAKLEAQRQRQELAAKREEERQADREEKRRLAEEERERKAAEREEAKRLKEEEREYKRQQAEEEREYKRKMAEEERARKEAEREEARRLKEEEREYKRQQAEEEREYKRKMAEEAKAAKQREALMRQAVSVAKSSSVQRGIFGMLKKLF